MACQKCSSDRIISMSAKCADSFSASSSIREYSGYVPDDLGIGGGDIIRLRFCLECGQLQADAKHSFPLPKSRLETPPSCPASCGYEGNPVEYINSKKLSCPQCKETGTQEEWGL